LPQTATDAELRLWIGLALCGAGLTLMLIWRRRHPAARSFEP
jgi:LPXTG-motif cell wall-anchored protein